MEFYMKLPRGKKEFALFMTIISVISVNIIAPLITCFEIGFYLQSWADTMKIVPILWLCIIAVVLATHKPAEWLTSKIVKEGDSFNAHIIINTLCTVLFMSIFLTVIGTWVGTRHISMEPLHLFFYKWPRNFAIAFGVELCIAQPIARAVMLRLHQVIDKREAKEPVPQPLD